MDRAKIIYNVKVYKLKVSRYQVSYMQNGKRHRNKFKTLTEAKTYVSFLEQ